MTAVPTQLLSSRYGVPNLLKRSQLLGLKIYTDVDAEFVLG